MNALAAFDTAFIANALDRPRSAVTHYELHSFAYLACLLSVYSGIPANDWGYEFASVPPAQPYAHAIADAASGLVRTGVLDRVNSTMSITDAGAETLSAWAGMHYFADRRRFLVGATGAALVLPGATVVNSLGLDPQLSRAQELGDSRVLFDDVLAHRLYQDLAALKEAVPAEAKDLMVPAVLYLQYLIGEAREAYLPHAFDITGPNDNG